MSKNGNGEGGKLKPNLIALKIHLWGKLFDYSWSSCAGNLFIVNCTFAVCK